MTSATSRPGSALSTVSAASLDRASGGSEPGELLERGRELAALTRCFGQASRGEGSAVLVSGPAGVGKTSLIDAFLASLDDEAPLILRGWCDDLIAPRPFGPFRDMVVSTGLLPDELAVDPDRESLLVALLGLLDRPTRPTVVVVDDAQWADDASIDVIRYLTRRLPTLHAMLIVASRDDEAGGHHTTLGLLGGSSSGTPVRVDLRPLSPAAVEVMARGSALDAGYLHEVSGGNPLLVHQLLAADPDEAVRMAQDTLLARIRDVSSDGLAVLQALAVVPDGVSPNLARVLFGDRPAALNEAEASGLVTSASHRLRFRYELGRTAVLDAMSFGERMAVTDLVLTALEETGQDPTALVHIARAAGDGPRATQFALQALDQALGLDHRQRWDLANIALEATAGLAPERIVALHSTAARSGRVVNRHAEALGHAERAVRLASSADVDDQVIARAWLDLADLQSDAGDHLRARSALRQARTLLDGEPVGPDSVACTIRQAAAAVIGGDTSRGIELATASIGTAEARAWTAELAWALGVRGQAANDVDDLTRAVDLGVGAEPSEHHVTSLLNLAQAQLRRVRADDAARAVDEAVRISRQHGFDRLDFVARAAKARILLHQGRTDEAERLAQELVDDPSDPGVARAEAEATLIRIAVRRADERAGGLVERSWTAAVATGEIERLAFAGLTRLEQLWMEGDDDGLRQFARYLMRLGERHGHRRLQAEAMRTVQRLGDDLGPVELDGADWPEPLASALTGDHRRSAELWAAAGEPYHQALELIEADDAAAAFEGLRLLDRIGAARTADLARHQLRRQGLQGVPRGPRRASEGTASVLTGRQVEVLRLIALGQTNAQIAGELFVARRTIDNHVSAILSRLGVADRTEAVEVAEARGVLDPDA
ncbi:MAG: ATP-binding protein [Acidimicrobiales bacterium]